MEAVLIILAMVVLLLLEGFFSGSEMALVNADKIRLHAKANQGHKGARLVLKLLERPDVLLTTTLVGTNISVVVLTTLGTLVMIRLFGEYGDLYAFLIFTPLLLTLGEIVPKSVYQQNANRLAPVVIYPLRLFRLLLYPVIGIFSLFARLAARLGGGRGAAHNLFITRQQIRTVVEMVDRGAHVDVFDQARIRRAARFADTSVGEAMVPLAEIIAIDRRFDTRTAFGLVRRHGYNRLPVYERNTGNVVGVVTLTVWDLMDRELEERPLDELIKPALYVSPLQNIDEVLPMLREREEGRLARPESAGPTTRTGRRPIPSPSASGTPTNGPRPAATPKWPGPERTCWRRTPTPPTDSGSRHTVWRTRWTRSTAVRSRSPSRRLAAPARPAHCGPAAPPSDSPGSRSTAHRP